MNGAYKDGTKNDPQQSRQPAPEQPESSKTKRAFSGTSFEKTVPGMPDQLLTRAMKIRMAIITTTDQVVNFTNPSKVFS